MRERDEDASYLMELLRRLIPDPEGAAVPGEIFRQRHQQVQDLASGHVVDPFTDADFKPPALPDGARGRGQLIPQRVPYGERSMDPFAWLHNQRFAYLDAPQYLPETHRAQLPSGQPGPTVPGGGYMGPRR